MHRLKLLLVVVLLALAVPFQGFAAASAGVCMAMDHHGSGHSHAADGKDQQDNQSHPAGSMCGSCFDCCASVAIATIGAVQLSTDTAVDRVVFKAIHHGSVKSAPPDRPPLAL